jgi:hypothetical protein
MSWGLRLGTNVKTTFQRWTCAHAFNRWHLVMRRLVGPYGTMQDEIQQRECDRCGYIQRAACDVAKERL